MIRRNMSAHDPYVEKESELASILEGQERIVERLDQIGEEQDMAQRDLSEDLQSLSSDLYDIGRSLASVDARLQLASIVEDLRR